MLKRERPSTQSIDDIAGLFTETADTSINKPTFKYQVLKKR